MASQIGPHLGRGLKLPIKGVLLDITGVLYESGSSKAIDGSLEAIKRLRNLGLPFRFVTNESQRTKQYLVGKLRAFGFILGEDEVIAPAPAVAKYLQANDLRPFLLVHPEVLPEFSHCDHSSPNCVVLGDAADHFNYHNLNNAFRMLLSLHNPILISMGQGKYYKEGDKLVLDVGAYAASLEFACNIKATIIGKPSPDFFQIALRELGIEAKDAVLVGDDINSDVGGAQNCGMQGVLVRTGKFRPCDENHETVKPDVIVKNLLEFIDQLTFLIKNPST